jgi:hypothetical protein
VKAEWFAEAIDRAVSERDFAGLTDWIRSPNLSAEDRDHLANTVLGLLNGDAKRPNHRPRKSKTKREAQDIAEDVVRLHRYRREWSKLSAAVKQVRGCSVSKVWDALKEHRVRAIVSFEEAEYDSMLDYAYTAETKTLLRNPAI